jgi:hypothetical protein
MSLRSRIEELERRLPRAVVLHRSDGTTFHHHGPGLRYVGDAFKEILEGRGPLRDAVLDTVSTEGTGHGLTQLLQAIANSPE